MNVLIDTPIWSLLLRRKDGSGTEVEALRSLVTEGRAKIVGPVRQEVLTGIREPKQYLAVRNHLRSFPDIQLTRDDFEAAADCANRCRAAGVQGSHTDFLLCAVALRRRLSIFTTDRDFQHFGKHLSIRLYHPD